MWPIPGAVIFVWFLGVFRHKGVVSNRWWNGKPMVIANSWTSNGVAEIPWDEFASGAEVFNDGYPSNLSSMAVLFNARNLIGERYDAVLSNCEHFVCKCHGLPPRSPQLAIAVIVAVLATTLVVASQS